jgi:hypothetical protein
MRPETALQIAIMAEMRKHGVEPVAVPNGAVLAGDAKARAIQMNSLKRQGLKVGFPDLVALMPFGQVGFIEVKCEGEKLTDKQAEVHEWLLALGHRVVVCRSVEDVRDTLREWGFAL